MIKKVLVILLILPCPAFAQTKSKYTPKMPNFFEGEKPRGELISVEQIVASKKNKQTQTDSFNVDAQSQNDSVQPKSVMGNPLGIIPKRKPIQQVVIQQPEPQKQEAPKDATTAELEDAVKEARTMSEQIRQSVGDNADFTNPKDIDKFVNASSNALQRGQLRRPDNNSKEKIEDFKF